jgi:glutaconate CoA-transferase subunit A
VDAVIIAEASRQVIVTAEEIVDRLDERDADGTFMPSILVDSVVHAPFGAHPGGLAGRYAPDRAAMQEYVAAARSDGAFAEYLERVVFQSASHEEYVERFVGERAGALAV